MAGATGLEPAASGVTGRRSNQLSYAPAGNAADLRLAPSQVKEGAVTRHEAARLRFAPARQPSRMDWLVEPKRR